MADPILKKIKTKYSVSVLVYDQFYRKKEERMKSVCKYSFKKYCRIDRMSWLILKIEQNYLGFTLCILCLCYTNPNCLELKTKN